MSDLLELALLFGRRRTNSRGRVSDAAVESLLLEDGISLGLEDSGELLLESA